MSAKSAVRYASNTTGVNLEKYLVWGAILAGGYFIVWPALQAAFAVKKAAGAVIDTAAAAIETSRDALSSGLYAIFGPNLKYDPVSYTVRFPDGKSHSVPSRSVKSDGTFVNKNLSPTYSGDGRAYRIVIDKRVPAGQTNKTAFPL